jgi:hypothetical protein
MAVSFAAVAAPAVAVDRWEAVSLVAPVGDDDSTTINEPRHGSVQVGHDFDSPSDQDWVKVATRSRRSYEARVWSGSAPWASAACPPAACASFDMVDSGGTVLVPGTSDGIPAASSSVRWLGADQTTLLRAASNTGLTAHTYDLAFYDTTYFLPRFNNTGTQVTVVIVQNTRSVAITGQIDFFNGAGTHLHSQPFSLVANGTEVFITSGVAALQNVSGSVSVAHTGGYGGLAGKGVALEPATGFTFDTALSPLPY